jgi:hypothetical protein
MRDSWLELVDLILRPERPHLARCLSERERHLEARKRCTDQRNREIASCEARIMSARAAVFAAKDGVVTSVMTDLEREWRRLSKRDPDGGLMDLWARIAPASWIDRKRWRDVEPTGRLDAALALASDPDGVERAENAAEALRTSLDAWGNRIGPRVSWQFSGRDVECTTELLAAPLRAAWAADPVVVERAQRLEKAVYERARARLPRRELLAGSIARVAFVDAVLRVAKIDKPNPAPHLFALWKTGYSLGGAPRDGARVCLELPPLERA